MRNSSLFIQTALALGIFGYQFIEQPACFAAETQTTELLTAAELQGLVDPIALYPDALLQTMLAAATFPDQIVDAALFVKTKADAQLVKDQSWDQSVKVIAGYPGVLSMMHQRIDWTTALGQAFMQQHRDLLASIQRIRLQAKTTGELASNEQQKVTTQTTASGTTIVVIEPQNPEVIYVPSDPYYNHYYTVSGGSHYDNSPMIPIASFGLGLAIGAALNDDDDHHYYGWGGPGYWDDDAPYNKWMDNRREAWEDYNDRAWDRQEHRQDMAKDRQEFRQEGIKNGTFQPPSADQRAAMKQNATDRQATRQSQTGTARSTLPSSQIAGQPRSTGGGYSKYSGSTQSKNLYQGSNRAQSRGWSAPTSSSKPSSSAFSGYGSRSQVSSYGSRGAASRGSSGFSRGGGGRRR